MTLPRSAADVLKGHVLFELECIDRIYLLTELRHVAAAQRAKRALPQVRLLTGMSCSAGAGTAESGHLVPNRSPTSSSVLLVGIWTPTAFADSSIMPHQPFPCQ
jgi:hypothetical protein